MVKQLDRGAVKAEVRELLRTAQVAPRGMTALFRALVSLLTVLVFFSDGAGVLAVFITVLANLTVTVLEAGYALYCMAIRRRERAEYLTLFDGFSLAGKVIVLQIVQGLLVALWAMLFVIPGLIAWYRYRFALYLLLDDPGMGPLRVLARSRELTMDWKLQLFRLDLSYLGWMLLMGLPEGLAAAWALLQGTDPATYLATPQTLPVLLAEQAWMLAAALLFYPNYVCAQLAYYEAARADMPGQEALPDDLGGWS